MDTHFVAVILPFLSICLVRQGSKIAVISLVFSSFHFFEQKQQLSLFFILFRNKSLIVSCNITYEYRINRYAINNNMIHFFTF